MHSCSHRRVVHKGKKDGRNWWYTIWPFTRDKLYEPKADQQIPVLDMKWINFWLIFMVVIEFPFNSIFFSVFAKSRFLIFLFAAVL